MKTELNKDILLEIARRVVGDREPIEDSPRSRHRIAYALEGLSGKQGFVLALRSQECTLRAIGEAIGVQQERVRQIEAKALRKLRHPARIYLILNTPSVSLDKYNALHNPDEL